MFKNIKEYTDTILANHNYLPPGIGNQPGLQIIFMACFSAAYKFTDYAVIL
jgi:hypothetical protein